MRTKKTKHHFRVRQTTYGAGKGLFAEDAIRKGDFIIEYTGKRILTKIADTLGTRYLFDLENGYTIDGSVMSNRARWVNHSCDANCEAELDDGHIYYYATRAIAPGEELTIDYGEEYFKEFIEPKGCKCAPCGKKHAARHAK